MAINWGETYGTIIDSAKWEESIEGYKITNVFGLAWNYYVIYTKFITGMDITLDMGLKCEFFFARTYKIGYAPDTSFGTDRNNCSPSCKNMYDGLQNMVTTVQEVIGQRQAIVEEQNLQIGVDNVVLEEQNVVVAGAQNIAVNGGLVQEVGAYNLAAVGDVNIEAPGVAINGVLAVNDGALEVLI